MSNLSKRNLKGFRKFSQKSRRLSRKQRGGDSASYMTLLNQIMEYMKTGNDYPPSDNDNAWNNCTVPELLALLTHICTYDKNQEGVLNKMNNLKNIIGDKIMKKNF